MIVCPLLVHVVTPPFLTYLSSRAHLLLAHQLVLTLSFHPNVLPLPLSLLSICLWFLHLEHPGVGMMGVFIDADENLTQLKQKYLEPLGSRFELAVTSFWFMC